MDKITQLKLNKDNDKLKYYVAFSYLHVRPFFKSKLVEYFDFDIERAYKADKNDLEQVASYYETIIPQGFIKKRDEIDVENAYKKAFSLEGVKIVTVEDDNYPPLLRQIPDFPLALYYKGDLSKIDYKYNVAVVGSRKASNCAKINLQNIIAGLKNTDITIVSGLAYGIDATAHQAAIENNLKTIAVIGSGLDFTYPSQNKDLYRKIQEDSGVIFTEYPLGIEPLAPNFPQRNRIVVGISKGTLVAEARLKSGAMISANLTLDYNRELMCMPGDILNPNTQGIYHLIKNGACIVTTHSDLLNQLGWDIITEEREEISLNENQSFVLDIISLEAKTFDEIALASNMQVSQTMTVLTELELKGLIKQKDNKYYKCR